MIFTLAARTGTSPRGDVDALIELAADIAIHAELHAELFPEPVTEPIAAQELR